VQQHSLVTRLPPQDDVTRGPPTLDIFFRSREAWVLAVVKLFTQRLMLLAVDHAVSCHAFQRGLTIYGEFVETHPRLKES